MKDNAYPFIPLIGFLVVLFGSVLAAAYSFAEGSDPERGQGFLMGCLFVAGARLVLAGFRAFIAWMEPA